MYIIEIYSNRKLHNIELNSLPNACSLAFVSYHNISKTHNQWKSEQSIQGMLTLFPEPMNLGTLLATHTILCKTKRHYQKKAWPSKQTFMLFSLLSVHLNSEHRNCTYDNILLFFQS